MPPKNRRRIFMGLIAATVLLGVAGVLLFVPAGESPREAMLGRLDVDRHDVRFESRPLSEVVAELSRLYGVTVEYEYQHLGPESVDGRIEVTVDRNRSTLREALDAIRKSAGPMSQVVIRGDKLVFTSPNNASKTPNDRLFRD